MFLAVTCSYLLPFIRQRTQKLGDVDVILHLISVWLIVVDFYFIGENALYKKLKYNIP